MWGVFFLASWCVCVASVTHPPPHTHLAQHHHSGDTVTKLKGICNEIGATPTDDDRLKLIEFLQFIVEGQNEAIGNLTSEVASLATLLRQAEEQNKQEEDKRLKLEDDVNHLTEHLQQEQDKLTQIPQLSNNITRLQQELLEERARVVQLLQDNGQITLNVNRLEQEKQEEAAKVLLLEEKVKSVQQEERAKVLLLEEKVKSVQLEERAKVLLLEEKVKSVQLEERAKVVQLENELAVLREVFGKAVKPRDCNTWLRLGYTQSAVYRIYPLEDSCEGVQAWCDMDTDGGGWTVFLSRQSQVPPLDFEQTWQTYIDGFGSAVGEYWLGNLYLHALTKDEQQELRLDVSDTSGDVRFAEWSEFSVGSEDSQFQMWTANFSPASTMGDVFPYTTPTMFSTWDQDNDHDRRSCASYFGRGGWWYRRCFNILPTALLPKGTGDPAIDEVKTAFWNPDDSTNQALAKLQLKIRPYA